MLKDLRNDKSNNVVEDEETKDNLIKLVKMKKMKIWYYQYLK